MKIQACNQYCMRDVVPCVQLILHCELYCYILPNSGAFIAMYSDAFLLLLFKADVLILGLMNNVCVEWKNRVILEECARGNKYKNMLILSTHALYTANRA